MNHFYDQDEQVRRKKFLFSADQDEKFYNNLKGQSRTTKIYRNIALGAGALAIFVAGRNGHYINPEEALSNPLADITAIAGVATGYFLNRFKKEKDWQAENTQDNVFLESRQLGMVALRWTLNEHSADIADLAKASYVGPVQND
jgi:hypothetical protein